MRGPALPSFKLLIAGALAAGIWAVRNDIQAPRPPEPVKARQPVESATARRPVEAVLPAAAIRPPRRPPQGVTGSVRKPVLSARQYRTSARVRLRGRAGAAAPVLSVLEAGVPVRELARSGQWRLVAADGRKGWVHADYLAAAAPRPPRPRAAVAPRTAAVARKAAEASAGGGETLRKP